MPIFSKLKPERLISEEGEAVRRELKSRISGYIVGAIGLVAALAWNDAITSLIREIFPQTSTTLVAKFIYAIIITTAAAVIGTYIVRVFSEKE